MLLELEEMNMANERIIDEASRADIFERGKRVEGFNFEALVDPRPLPDALAAANLDGADASRYELALRVAVELPSNICREYLRYFNGDSTAANMRELAALCGVSERTLHNHISKAKSKIASPPHVGTYQTKGAPPPMRRGAQGGVTYAAKRRDKLTERSEGNEKEHGGGRDES